MNKVINIIGMGEVGVSVYDALTEAKLCDLVLGVDINRNTIISLRNEGYYIVDSIIKNADVYIITAYLTEQVFSILDQLKNMEHEVKPLVSIESTLHPNAVNDLKKYTDIFDIVLFPHRYNPGDPEHFVFNLDRIIGGFKKESVERAIKFFSEYMDTNLIHIFPVDIVNLSKPAENWYRFAEISLAQELYLACQEKGIDFDMLRDAMRTKWNIGLLNAQEGIGGKCLPKDSLLMADYFKKSDIFNYLYNKNEEYKIKKAMGNYDN